MIENIDENSTFTFIKEINEDFKKISQVLHSSYNNFPNNKIELIDKISIFFSIVPPQKFISKQRIIQIYMNNYFKKQKCN